MVKLKDTLPKAPILAQAFERNGEEHSNFVSLDIEMGNGATHVFAAHYSEFTPAHQDALKTRLRQFVDDCLSPEQPEREAAANQMFEGIYQHLHDRICHHKDLKVVKNPRTGEIGSISVSTAMQNIEQAYRDALPILGKQAGMLLEAETELTPQIIITNAPNIGSLVGYDDPAAGASGYACKHNGERTNHACDVIYMGNNIDGLYEAFNTHRAGLRGSSDVPEDAALQEVRAKINHAIPFMLSHELTHHLGLDELASTQAHTMLPALERDMAFHQQFLQDLQTLAQTPGPQQQATAEKLGFVGQGKYKAYLESIRQEHPEARNHFGMMMSHAESISHGLLHVLVEGPRTSLAGQTGAYDTSDEILPGVIMAQSAFGAGIMRASLPNTYPVVEKLLAQHGHQLSQSVNIGAVNQIT